MKTIKPHIRIFTENNQTVLQVDTWELKDYLEDYLCEQCDIDYEYYENVNPELRETSRESYNLVHSEKYSFEQIEQAVLKLDEKELVEIVKFQQSQINVKFECPYCGFIDLRAISIETGKTCKNCINGCF
jgi:hypothetical protein